MFRTEQSERLLTKIPPLLSHRPSYSRKCAASFLPSLGPGAGTVDTRLAPIDNLRRSQRRKVLQPQACSPNLAVPELPRLNRLGVWFVDPLPGIPVHDWIFHTDPWDIGTQQGIEEFTRDNHAIPSGPIHGPILVVNPAHTGIAKVGAWRMSDHQIPPSIKDVPDIGAVMTIASTILRWQQVARLGVDSAADVEGFPDNAGELAGD